MKITRRLLYSVLTVGGSLLVGSALSQDLIKHSMSTAPVERLLMTEHTDFRKTLFGKDFVELQIQRGTVCLLRPDFKITGRFEERSTNNWSTVSAVIQSATSRDPRSARPQIRIVQKNAILQSNFDFASGEGLSASFLSQQLEPGDIVIVTTRVD